MKNFKKLPVWQKGMELATQAHTVRMSFPDTKERYLGHEFQQIGIRIPANIAIGSSYENDSDYRSFLRISLGACFELETLIILSRNVGLGDETALSRLSVLIDEEKKLLMDFIKQLIMKGF